MRKSHEPFTSPPRSSSPGDSLTSIKNDPLAANPTSPITSPPRITFSPWTKKYSIIVCTFGLLLFDLILPCAIFYSLAHYTSLILAVNLGISCACLGLGELLELPLRGYRLVAQRDLYAPLGQQAKWAFDIFFWWYVVATVIGVVPYVFATSLDEPILWLFLMTPGLLVGFASLTAAVTIFPFRLPFRVSSDVKGTPCKPFVYYVVEDFVSVDAGQGRKFREEWSTRWDASPVFQRLVRDVNLWWCVGGEIFIGALAGVTWGVDFQIAYGLSFGLLFIWMGIWAGVTWIWVRRELRRESEWFARKRGEIDVRDGGTGVKTELDIV